jgi:hypothetical protein
MCWNEHVSLNTFLFSFGVLLLVMYNNAYTPYKIPCSAQMYLFLASFISMQLIEFFIWRNLHNAYNHLFSLMALLLIAVQPLISLTLLPEPQLRTILLVSYVALVGGYIATHLNRTAHCKVSKNGHLQWWFLTNSNGTMTADELLRSTTFYGWLFFLLFSFVYNKRWLEVVLAALTLGVSMYTYAKDKTISSMWCWMVNGYMVIMALYLLVWLPYAEHGFCV